MAAEQQTATSLRATLHRLVDELPDAVEDLDMTRRFLEAMLRQEVFWDAAWIDNAPLTEDEIEGIREAREDVEAGRTRTLDEVRRELDL
jgi:hypothetical protein